MTLYMYDDDLTTEERNLLFQKLSIDDAIRDLKEFDETIRKEDAKETVITFFVREYSDLLDDETLDLRTEADREYVAGIKEIIEERKKFAESYFEERWETWDEWKDQL